MEKLKSYTSRLREVKLLPILAYWVALYGVIGVWIALAGFAGKNSGYPIAIAIFAAIACLKTYATHLAHRKSELGWMAAVGYVPFAEVPYLIKNKMTAPTVVEVEEAA